MKICRAEFNHDWVGITIDDFRIMCVTIGNRILSLNFLDDHDV